MADLSLADLALPESVVQIADHQLAGRQVSECPKDVLVAFGHAEAQDCRVLHLGVIESPT